MWIQYQDAAVQKVVDFMNAYSLSQEDFDTVVELSKFKVGKYIIFSLAIREGLKLSYVDSVC